MTGVRIRVMNVAMNLHRYARLEGDAAEAVSRTAQRGPMMTRIFVGTETVPPKRTRGGPTTCPSVTLAVYPDGTWTLLETKNNNTRVVAQGTLA